MIIPWWCWRFRFGHLDVQFDRIYSNYSDTTGSSWFYFREEETFKYKAKLLKNAVADGNNSILKNKKIYVPLKYLSTFRRSLGMSLNNCKV